MIGENGSLVIRTAVQDVVNITRSVFNEISYDYYYGIVTSCTSESAVSVVFNDYIITVTTLPSLINEEGISVLKDQPPLSEERVIKVIRNIDKVRKLGTVARLLIKLQFSYGGKEDKEAVMRFASHFMGLDEVMDTLLTILRIYV